MLFAAGQALAVAIVVVGLVIEEGNGEDNGGFKSLADIPTKVVSKQRYRRGLEQKMADEKSGRVATKQTKSSLL